MTLESMSDETATTPEPISTEQFERDDPRALYARLRPDQRTAIGEEFARYFRLGEDASAREMYSAEIKGMLTAEQVAAMHVYARDHHPEILEKVMQHPVTRASLESPGAKPDEVNLEAEQVVGPNAPGSADLPTRVEHGLLP
ncbi:MAG TPA: hypothetical protein VKQ30_19305 [Ktedonobacterales bacterium]|nr:hypothetical protein [Ktedonobacterales bacterium]